MMMIKKIVLSVSLALGSGLAMSATLNIIGPSPNNNYTGGSPPATCWTQDQGGPDQDFLSSSLNLANDKGCNAGTGFGLAYKIDAPSTESGTLAGSYASSAFTGGAAVTISYTGGTFVDCQLLNSCWLVVKDGNQDPARYGYNLSGIWNGTDSIAISNFWTNPQNGAISHVAIYNKATTDICTVNCFDEIPEPASLALVGVALAGMGLVRRRRRD